MDPRAFSGFESDLQMVEGMVREQSVFPLPGMCFNIKNFFRIVLTVPKSNMVEACDRIAEFCAQHYTVRNKRVRMNKSILSSVVNHFPVAALKTIPYSPLYELCVRPPHLLQINVAISSIHNRILQES